MSPREASTSTSWSERKPSACSANHRNPEAHLATSPLAWAKGLPISVVTRWAMSGSSASNRSATVVRRRDRSAKVVFAHTGAVAAAAARRVSTPAPS